MVTSTYTPGTSSHTLDLVCQRFLRTAARADLESQVGWPLEIPNFGRTELAEMFRELGFKTGAEIGVKAGEYSEVLCKANPGLKLYCVDPWKSYEGYRNGRQDGMDAFFAKTQERLKPYDYQLVREFSVKAAKGFADNSLDFVYIDANHDFFNVVSDIHAWLRVVRTGGILAGHDYIRRGPKRDGRPNVSHHVIEAVNGYTQSYNIEPWYVLGRKDIVEGEIRDLERSWMWVV